MMLMLNFFEYIAVITTFGFADYNLSYTKLVEHDRYFTPDCAGSK